MEISLQEDIPKLKGNLAPSEEYIIEPYDLNSSLSNNSVDKSLERYESNQEIIFNGINTFVFADRSKKKIQPILLEGFEDLLMETNESILGNIGNEIDAEKTPQSNSPAFSNSQQIISSDPIIEKPAYCSENKLDVKPTFLETNGEISLSTSQERSLEPCSFSSTIQDSATLAEAISERIKDCNAKLSRWLVEWTKSLKKYRPICEFVVKQTDSRLKDSDQNLITYTNFIKERYQQETQFLSQSITKTDNNLTNNRVSRSVYINCTILLNSLHAAAEKKNLKVKDLLEIIREASEKLQNHFQQSKSCFNIGQQGLVKTRSQISKLKQDVKTVEAEISKTAEVLKASLGKEIELSHATQAETRLVKLTTLYRKVLKALGLASVEYFELAVSVEKTRSQVIRDALLLYCKATKELNGFQESPQLLQQLSKFEQKHLIKQLYCLEDMIGPVCPKELTEQVSPVHLRNFFNKYYNRYFRCNTPLFTQSAQLLKEFTVQIKRKGIPETKGAWMSSFMVLTLQLDLQFYSAQRNGPPLFALKISSDTLEVSQSKDGLLCFKQRSKDASNNFLKNWIIKDKPDIKVRFQKEKQRVEFMGYLSNVMKPALKAV